MDIQQQKSYKILLVGDSCIDIYHYGECTRISPEAPIPILKQTHLEEIGGMSLNVKNNLESFNLKVTHMTNTQMIEKHRLVDNKSKYQIARLDMYEEKLLDEISISHINPEKYDCLVISDYCKGTIRKTVSENLCSLFREKPVFIDTKKHDLRCFSNAFIKINEHEKALVTNIGKNLKFITTLGSKGTLYNDKLFKAEQVDVFDVCGAGDVFLASLVNYYLKTKKIDLSITIANKLAAKSVTKAGTYVLSRGDISEVCF